MLSFSLVAEALTGLIYHRPSGENSKFLPLPDDGRSISRNVAEKHYDSRHDKLRNNTNFLFHNFQQKLLIPQFAAQSLHSTICNTIFLISQFEAQTSHRII